MDNKSLVAFIIFSKGWKVKMLYLISRQFKNYEEIRLTFKIHNVIFIVFFKVTQRSDGTWCVYFRAHDLWLTWWFEIQFVAECLITLFDRFGFGPPKILQSDNGTGIYIKLCCFRWLAFRIRERDHWKTSRSL